MEIKRAQDTYTHREVLNNYHKAPDLPHLTDRGNVVRGAILLFGINSAFKGVPEVSFVQRPLVTIN